MIETDTDSIHVVDRGMGEPTLVFIHYWGGSHRTWNAVMTALQDRYRCLVPDLPGWGRSKPSERGCRIADLAASIDEMIPSLALDRVILIGHSMGGKVVQYLAGQRPAWIEGLVLVAPSPALPMEIPESWRDAMLSVYDSRESVGATLDNVLTATPLEGMVRNQAIADSLAGNQEAKTAWPAYAMLEDVSEMTRRIEVPTLLLSGECDRVDPPAALAERLVPFLPDPEVQELPDAGHLLPLEATNAVAQHIARWSKTDSVH